MMQAGKPGVRGSRSEHFSMVVGMQSLLTGHGPAVAHSQSARAAIFPQ
jgi:hypothetical protein